MRGRSALMHPVSFNNVVPIGLKYSSSESQVWGRCLRLRLITSQRAVVLQTPRCLLDLLDLVHIYVLADVVADGYIPGGGSGSGQCQPEGLSLYSRPL